MKFNFLATSIIFITLAIPLNSNANDSIIVGGVTLRIGMDKNYVLSELAKYNDIRKISESDVWLIISKLNLHTVGSVDFHNEKLVFVNKFWGSFSNKDALEIGEELYAIFSKFDKEGRNIANFYTQEAIEPDSSLKIIHFLIGKKKISLFISYRKKESDIPNSFSITEALRQGSQ